MKKKLKILIIYKYLGYPLRATIDEHLYSFLRYADADCFYLKLDPRTRKGVSQDPIPPYLLKIDFDIILFHYGFISSRWAGQEHYLQTLSQVLSLKESKAIKAVMPQDEYMDSRSIVHFISEMNIDVVFSVSPESEWDQLYEGVNREKVKFHKVLTGYLDEKNALKINRLLKSVKKDIDIGYRARNLPQWLGRHGHMKTVIADVFNQHVKKFRLKADISTDPKDTFFGMGWYKFMVRCKYMIGVEGGATVHDRDGSISKKGAAFLEANPNCSFEEIEEACFPGLDGKLQLIAISPRNLESCATMTCQILVESSYNGILKPHVHYIPLKKDFSNIDEVLLMVENDSKRKEIVENAHRDIVASGLYSYKNFVNLVIDTCMAHAGRSLESVSDRNLAAYSYNRFLDWFYWRSDFFWNKIYRPFPHKWFFLIPMIKLIKFLRLKNTAKFVYFAISRKKSWP